MENLPTENTDFQAMLDEKFNIDLYERFRDPTNPYIMYNNQDRFLNAVSRAWTAGLVGDYGSLHLGGKFTYNKVTNVLSQYQWTTSALPGVGYSINLRNLSSSSEDKQTLAELMLARSVINAGLESILLLANSVTINGGDGDDTVIANPSRLGFDGGAGHDTVSYAGLGSNAGIVVTPTATSFSMAKTMRNADVYTEVTKAQDYQYGKRTETVEYRDVELRQMSLNHVDTLTGVEAIHGSDGADSMTGNAEANMFFGGAGNDVLNGEGGNDVLAGGAGADTVTGGDGNDVIIQEGDWRDRLGDSLDGGAGIDTLDYRSGRQSIQADLAAGSVRKELYFVGDGEGQGGQSFVVHDTIRNIENVIGSALDDTIRGDASSNLLSGNAGADTLYGADGDDILLGGDGDDHLQGGAGDDVLAGEDGIDTIEGGDGDDVIVQDDYWPDENGTGDVLDGGAGIDTADYSGSTGGIEADQAFGYVSTPIFYAKGGYYDGIEQGAHRLRNIENLIGTAHNDVLKGDANANGLFGGAGNDIIAGAAGNDTIEGNAGEDSLRGGAGDDLLTGGAGADSVEGGAGNDVIGQHFENVADTLDGGEGIDTVDYSISDLTGTTASGIRANLAAGRVDKLFGGGGNGSDTMQNIENLTGTALDDTLIGDGNANALSGGAGNDTIEGGEGADLLAGRAGNDTLAGGAGADVYLFARRGRRCDPGKGCRR